MKHINRVFRAMGESKIIGISGGSGSGKTTLAKAIAQYFDGQALHISYDRYYKYMPCGNYDIPEALNTSLLLEHLDLLRSSKPAPLPIYDLIYSRPTAFIDWVQPQSYIIVEGIFALLIPELLKLYHCKVFVDVPTEIRYKRRLLRDVQERGDTEERVCSAWVKNALPMHYQLIEPQRANADLMLSGETQLRDSVGKVVAWLR
jgi:uridine kinase